MFALFLFVNCIVISYFDNCFYKDYTPKMFFFLNIINFVFDK